MSNVEGSSLNDSSLQGSVFELSKSKIAGVLGFLLPFALERIFAESPNLGAAVCPALVLGPAAYLYALCHRIVLHTRWSSILYACAVFSLLAYHFYAAGLTRLNESPYDVVVNGVREQEESRRQAKADLQAQEERRKARLAGAGNDFLREEIKRIKERSLGKPNNPFDIESPKDRNFKKRSYLELQLEQEEQERLKQEEEAAALDIAERDALNQYQSLFNSLKFIGDTPLLTILLNLVMLLFIASIIAVIPSAIITFIVVKVF